MIDELSAIYTNLLTVLLYTTRLRVFQRPRVSDVTFCTLGIYLSVFCFVFEGPRHALLCEKVVETCAWNVFESI